MELYELEKTHSAFYYVTAEDEAEAAQLFADMMENESILPTRVIPGEASVSQVPPPELGWVLTDPDFSQFVRPVGDDNQWEVIQLQPLTPDPVGGEYGVVRTVVHLNEYIGEDAPSDNKADLEFILDSYGYKGLNDVASCSGAACFRIVAECVAETIFMGYDRSCMDFVGSEAECVAYIEKIVQEEK